MSDYTCPECGGSFPKPVRIETGANGIKHGCPWCGETARYDMRGVES